MTPIIECSFYRFTDRAKMRKILIVKTYASGQLPHSFDWIQVRAVRGYKEQLKLTSAFLSPGVMPFGMMIPCVI